MLEGDLAESGRSRPAMRSAASVNRFNTSDDTESAGVACTSGLSDSPPALNAKRVLPRTASTMSSKAAHGSTTTELLLLAAVARRPDGRHLRRWPGLRDPFATGANCEYVLRPDISL